MITDEIVIVNMLLDWDIFSALFLGSSVLLAEDPFSGPIGWADVPGDAGTGNMIQTTTGGTGGTVVVVESLSTLKTEISILFLKRDVRLFTLGCNVSI